MTEQVLEQTDVVERAAAPPPAHVLSEGSAVFVDELGAMMSRYYNNIGDGDPIPSVDVVFESFQKLLVTAMINDSRSRSGSSASAPARKSGGSANGAAPKQARGGGQRRKRAERPRNVSAYCDCGADCWRDFNEDYQGCDCDPQVARKMYNGEDAGPCGCIMPSPLMGGVVEMVEGANGGWRWVEAV